MSTHQQSCDNCIFVSFNDPDAMYGYTCLCPHPKLFKTDIAKPHGYCVHHEPDLNKKPQKKGKI